MVAAAQQAALRRGVGGLGGSGPNSLELEDARPLLPGKPAARSAAAPAKAQLPSLRLMLCWSALFAVYLGAFHTSLMVGPRPLTVGLLGCAEAGRHAWQLPVGPFDATQTSLCNLATRVLCSWLLRRRVAVGGLANLPPVPYCGAGRQPQPRLGLHQCPPEHHWALHSGVCPRLHRLPVADTTAGRPAAWAARGLLLTANLLFLAWDHGNDFHTHGVYNW